MNRPERAEKLPLLISVPHAGLSVPPEVEPFCVLRKIDVLKDGDVGAAEIFWGLEEIVECFITADVARAVLDLNRDVDDRRKDGVVKTHTCWDVPIYRHPLPEDVVADLLETYYYPYHELLSSAPRDRVRLGLDCHTMADTAPPVAPDSGRKRPAICLSNGDGTCPDGWIEILAESFESSFGPDVRINDPFRGGFITRSHSRNMPWIQVEVSRGPFLTNAEKAERVRDAIQRFCARADRLWDDSGSE